MKIQAGHRLGILTGTNGLHVSMHAAAQAQEFTLVPIPMRHVPEAMATYMDQARVDVVITDEDHQGLARRVAGKRPILVCDQHGTPVAEIEGELGPPADPGVYAVLQTSGTTQAPRIIDIPQSALAAHAEAAKKRLGADEASVWLACLPLWHVGGLALVHRCLHGGGRLVLQERFDPAMAVEAMQEHAVTHVSVVPTMLHRILALGVPPPESLRCMLVGGDALPVETVQGALEAGWPLYVSYGLSEACSQVATATTDELRIDPASCGHPLEGVELTIRDESGEVAPGQVAQIVVDGPTLAVPGPLGTGDLGRMDDGRLKVLGRVDDRITTGGEKVDPRRVEEILRLHPGVHDAAVVGIPDAEWGQQVVAAVVGEVDARQLIDHARASLAAHEVPKKVRVVASLPRTAAGKLRRGQVRHEWQ